MAGITRISSPSITDSLEAGITGGNTGRWCTAHLQHPEFLKAMQISRLGQSKLKRWLCAGDWDHIYKACTTVPGKGSMSARQKQLFTTRCTCHCQQNAPPVHTAAFMPEAPQQHPHLPGAGITKAVSLPLPLGSGFLSGFTALMMQILSMTSLTGPGGFCMDFTRVMSEGFRVLRAASAAAKAGRASARSASHSSC